MFSVYLVQAYCNNGRRNWSSRDHEYRFLTTSILYRFLTKALQINPYLKKNLKRALIVSIIAPLLMYRTCICFYNAEVGFYSFSTGFGMNTYATRFFQLKRSCPPGPPCHMYATVPQNPEEAFFLNLHTHVDVSNVTVYYQEVHTETPDNWLTV